MSAPQQRVDFIVDWNRRIKDILALRTGLSKEELDDLALRVDKLRDERLKELVAKLMGWGDAETAELEYFVLVAFKLMKTSRPSVVRKAAEAVELEVKTRQIKNLINAAPAQEGTTKSRKK